MSKNYVKKHKDHDVPDGATHYGKAHGMYKACFYMMEEGRGLFFNPVLSTEWMVSGHGDIPPHATELPEQDLPNWDDWEGWAKQGDLGAVWITDRDDVGLGWFKLNKSSMTYEELHQPIGRIKHRYTDTEEVSGRITVHKRPIAIEDKEWLPEVGEECQIAESTEYLTISHTEGMEVKIYSRFTDDRGVVLFAFVALNGKQAGVATGLCFKPLKTAEELERESLLEVVKGYQPVLMLDKPFTPLDVKNALNCYAENIIDNFDIITKGDK